MKITVIIPTYCRPRDLAYCLDALKQQTRPAEEILVIVRDTDSKTWSFLESYNFAPLPLHTVRVTIPGQVAALNAGLDQARGEIVSFTDDDAVPHPEWLARIEAHFLSDSCIGGVGGKDWVYQNDQLLDGRRLLVGRVQWFGRAIGSHHFGVGEPREVEILRGVNMSYRRSAIANFRFDERLLGTGAQVDNDLAFSLTVKRAGWKLIYDPRVEVDHYMTQRFDEDQRHKFNYIAMMNRVYNETLILLEYLPPIRRVVFLAWAILVGTRDNRGFIQWLRFLPREGSIARKKLLASLQGRWLAWLAWQQIRS
jgi:cellulose synthase/poly-beta-1,6-N-acetylglucosamine synthase-like glycosyltransferase